MINKLTCLFLFIFPLHTLFAQDSLLVEKIQQHIYPLQYDSGKLSGEGLKFLKEEAKSPFFLIGEAHGFQETAQFTAALFREFRHHGYQYFATETGPYTAKYLEQTVKGDNWKSEFREFLQKYPWSVPFYSWKEEGEVLQSVIAEGKEKQDMLWGLDQEFAASFRMNFLYLQQSAKTDQQKELANKYYDKAMHDFEVSMKTLDPSKSFLGSIRPDDFAKLKQAFADQPDDLDRIKELEESVTIYQLWFQREGLKSNQMRAEMMKRHFWNYYQQASKQNEQPKVMFKFGANHMFRGANPLNVFDIGNFISELASQQGTSSFHLYVLGRKGTQNVYTPFSQSTADKEKAFNAETDDNELLPVLQACSEDGWSIVDLRPIRKALFNKSIRNINPDLKKLIWSYDAVLVISEMSALTDW